MNLKEIEYIVTLAQEQKLTRAAEKLFITPSALTQQVTNLEKRLGLPLFYRSRNGWLPTEAGSIYLQSAREILQIRQKTDKRLQDLADSRQGTLNVGITSEHGSSTFTHIYPAFHKQYSEVTINIYETNVRSQQQMLASCELDLGIMTLSRHQQTEDVYIPLANEEIVLAVPSLHPACHLAVPTAQSPYPELNPDNIRHEPFAMMYNSPPCMKSSARPFRNMIFPRKPCFTPSALLPPWKWYRPASAAVLFRAFLPQAPGREVSQMYHSSHFPPIPPGRSMPAIKKAVISLPLPSISYNSPGSTGANWHSE